MWVTRYDTVHGVYPGEVSHDGEHLIVDGTKIKVMISVGYVEASCSMETAKCTVRAM